MKTISFYILKYFLNSEKKLRSLTFLFILFFGLPWFLGAGFISFLPNTLRSVLLIGKNIDSLNSQGETALMQAVLDNDLANVKYLISQGASAKSKYRDKDGNSILMLAVKQGNLEILKAVFESKGSDIKPTHFNQGEAFYYHSEEVGRIKNREGDTALRVAAKNGQKELTLFLFEKMGIQVKKGSEDKWMEVAKQVELEELLEYLYKYNSYADEKLNYSYLQYGDAPLVYFAGKGELPMLKLLVILGADVHQKNDLGQTALHTAAKEIHSDCVNFLIEKGATIDAKDDDLNTPLFYTMSGNQTRPLSYWKRAFESKATQFTDTVILKEMAKLKTLPLLIDKLLKKGASPLLENRKKETPLSELIKPVQIQIEVETEKEDGSVTKRFKTFYGISTEKHPIISSVLSNKAFEENWDKNGILFNFFEGWHRHSNDHIYLPDKVKFIKMLIEKGAYANAIKNTRKNGKAYKQALIIKALDDSSPWELIKVLLEGDADVDVFDWDKRSVLMLSASSEKYLLLTKYCLLKGISVNQQDNDGKTALMKAVYYKNIEAVKLLLANHSKLDMKDTRGKTALEIAEYEGEIWLLIKAEMKKRGIK